MSIMGAINDPRIFGKHFAKDPGSWAAWFAFLRTLFGEPLDDDDLAVFRECTSRQEPHGPYKQATLCCGRRGGKSYIMALIAVYLAAFRDYRPYLAAGERAMIVIVCPDRDQAQNLLRFIEGMFEESKVLSKLIEHQTRDTFELNTRVTISVMTASYKTIRGYTIACAIVDECAFLPGDDSASPASEIIAAVKPALGTIPGSMLICASSPKGKSGVLWDAYTKHFGIEDSPHLLWKAPTLTMHPTYDEQIIKDALADEPAEAYAEYFAEFRDDVAACFSRDVVEACVEKHCFERPPVDGVTYTAFVDTSGGRADSYTMAIAHLEKFKNTELAVLDLLFESRPPFHPPTVTKEICDILATYGITKITGDNFGQEWVAAEFDDNHVTYTKSENVRSTIYLSSVRHLNSGLAVLLDSRRLVAQICALERQQLKSGRESVNHPNKGHDDLANSALGVIDLCLSNTSNRTWEGFRKNADKLAQMMYGYH